jgi:hypothetical protein
MADTTDGPMYSHTSCSEDIATITTAGADVGGAVDDAVGTSFVKAVSDDVGGAVNPVLRISLEDTVGVAVDKLVSAGVGDAVGVEFSRDVGNILFRIRTVDVKKQKMKEEIM